jgi:tetratricopeptide (TPR) repeat protein
MLRNMHDRLEQVGRLDLLEPIARKTILHYDLGHMRGEPRSSSEARAHKRLGDVFLRRSDSEHALAEYRRAKEIMSSVAASHPEKVPLRRDLAVLDDNIADVLAARGDVDGALAAYRGALAVFVDLTHLDPKERQFQTDVAFAHMRIGSLLQTRGDQRGSLDELRAARAIEAELARAQPDDLGSRSMLSTLDNEIGDALDSLGDHDGALASYESARDLAIAIAASSPTPEHRRDVMVALYKLAQVYRHHGERDLAADNTRRALEIARANAAHDPDNAIWKRDIEINESDLGDDLRAGGRLDDTQAAYDDVLAIATDIAAHDPSSADAQWDLANALERVGNLDLQRKHLDRAAERYQAAFEIHTREAARDPSSAEWQRGVAISHTKLSDVALARGDTATAVAEARTAQTLARRIADASKSAGAQTDLASVDQQLGKTLLAAHDKSAAVEALREAIELLEPLAAKNPEVAKDLGDLRADLARALGR